MYSAINGIVHYKESLKSFEIRVGLSPGFLLPSVGILPQCAERNVKQHTYMLIYGYGNVTSNLINRLVEHSETSAGSPTGRRVPHYSLSDGILSINSQAIVTKFCNHYYPVIWQQPCKFREIPLNISKVRLFDM